MVILRDDEVLPIQSLHCCVISSSGLHTQLVAVVCAVDQPHPLHLINRSHTIPLQPQNILLIIVQPPPTNNPLPFVMLAVGSAPRL